MLQTDQDPVPIGRRGDRRFRGRKGRWLTVWALVCVAVLLSSPTVWAESPYFVVLGVAQDAGAPQMGCDSPFCREAWKDRDKRKMVSSIALVDPASNSRWIFDATPDLPEQFELLKEVSGDRGNSIDGIFLTHAHIGHYTGLMYLGFESMNAKGVKVFAMPRMLGMLKSNAPWSQLVSFNNIELKALEDGERVSLNDRISVTPFLVPHRDEFSETVGYRVDTGSGSLVFIPDIDKWSKWETKLADVVRENDLVLVDATFFADGEIPRPIDQVPHPFVSETMELLGGLPEKERRKVYFIHMNHSNPLLQGDAEARSKVRAAGFNVAAERQVLRPGETSE